MKPQYVVKTNSGTVVKDPPIASLLFNDTRLAPVWGIIRVFLGIAWLQAGLHKLEDPAWTVTGEALKGFWVASIPKSGFVWYGGFLQSLVDSGSYTWFAKLIVAGELLVGIALILGAFVGIAALFGGFMNWNFIMAGSASVNGLYFFAAVLLILAWKTAGHYGLDRYLLPRLGTPWKNDEPEVKTAPAATPAGLSPTKA
ncbi:MAG TPA: DoxX family membrane protein [Aggregatilineales bacterium]|nr:DoxX family membrane protein [Aggregatilineales bacterium]